MPRGSVTRRGDSWRIAVELEPDPITGKRRQRFETFPGSKRDADKRLTELLSLRDQQRLGVNPKMTVCEYLDAWMRDHASTLAPITSTRYQSLFDCHVKPRVGALQLGKLTTARLVRLFAEIRDSDRADGRPGKASPQLQMHVYRALHVALQHAVKWGVLPANPLDGVSPPKVPRREMKTYGLEDARRFLAATEPEGHTWQAYFLTAMLGGLRSSELRGLRWCDVDLGAGVIRVQQTIMRVSGFGLVTKPPKSASGRRAVDIDSGLVAILRRHGAEQGRERLSLGPLWKGPTGADTLVFPSEAGTPIEDSRVYRVFGRVCERAGLPRLRPYDLRHACASLLLAAGTHPKVVSERLGHSSIALTLSTYSHTVPSLQREAAETLGRMLGSGS